MVSDRRIMREIEKRLVTRFMDILVFSLLNHDCNEIGGYDLIKYLHNKFQLLVSSGTVYSTLHGMERNGLLEGYQNGGRRVYTLTQKGESKAKTILNAEPEIKHFMSTIFNHKASIPQ